jgi:hypothetical protein
VQSAEKTGETVSGNRISAVLTGVLLVCTVSVPGVAQAASSQPAAGKNPPSGVTWWFARDPGPGSIVALWRSGSKVQFVDNWAPCFTGQRVRRLVYRGGGLNQNAYYSRQMMKLWVSSGRLHAKRAFVGYEKLPDVALLKYRPIPEAKARSLLKGLGLSVGMYFDDC